LNLSVVNNLITNNGII